jgi:hypothetical protein
MTSTDSLPRSVDVDGVDPSTRAPVRSHRGPQPAWRRIGTGPADLIAATFVFARAFARSGESRWAWFSRVTGIVFAAGFAGLTTGSSSAPIILGFWAAIALAFAWLAATPGANPSEGRT